MSTYKELLYDGPISRVKGIQFCILSPDDIVKRSVVEVTRNASYSGNEPDVNGLYDSRMGVVDHGKLCRTCLQKREFCPGHFGHLVLAKPVFYVQFMDVVRKLLRCVCFRCSKALVDPEAPAIRSILRRNCTRQKRWEAMHKECAKVKRCESCGAKQPDRIIETEQKKMKLEWRDSSNTATSELVMNAEDVLRVFRRITEEDAEVLGFSSRFNRPEWMICTVLPVPPPSMRPSVRSDTGQRSEDDLTHILSDIVKFNALLAAKIEKGASYETVDIHAIVLQYHVSTLVDNSVPTMYATSKDRTGRTLRTLVDRLKSKEGRIRGNLMGKRVDFSARTVITPDPNLSIDELGVPLQIATNLTFPEIVSRGNFDRMRQLVRNGPDVHPGAKHVRKTHQGMRTIRLKGNDTSAIEAELELGDVVERHLQNGDYVLFNRQPSLHKMSMMAHRVRVMPHKTFRLNVCVCASYNADFDGDEMNMHLPQSLQTHEEIKHLAAVPLHIISPRNSKPIVTIAQDVLLGVFRMTLPDVRVGRRQFMNLTCSNNLYHCRVPEPLTDAGGYLTGHDLLSTVIPANTNHRGRLGDPDEGDESKRVIVRDGRVLQGSMRSSAYDMASRGLVHSIFNDKGPDAVTAFLNNTQKLACDWLVLSGFSVGVSDLVLEEASKRKLKWAIEQMKADVYSVIREVHNDRFENKGTGKNADFLEKSISDVISKWNKELQNTSMATFGAHNNRMINMIKEYGAGSKGSIINFGQMVASVGQQMVDNRRVIDGFDGRTLPHFTKFDDGPNSRGFVENSFIGGLTPTEFFFHSMGGRIGLIDTAVRSVTWDTPVFLLHNGERVHVRLGEWIDARFETAERQGVTVRRYPDALDMEVLELDAAKDDVSVPTIDASGIASWGKLTAVTRHDPGARLFEVRTESGREVKVADSESLLVWREETRTFEKTQSRDVVVGDYLPVVVELLSEPFLSFRGSVAHLAGREQRNDAVLDPVVSIEELGVEGHPKLYDVTVPSTLNFVLANGLGVRDTSETGYLQRKLVKSMEDCKVNHDMTVRNAAGHIVQFVYGEDGADAAKIEYHSLPYMEMDDAEMQRTFLLATSAELRPHVQPEVLEAVSGKEEAAFRSAMEAHYARLREDRRFVVLNVHRGKRETRVLFPVHLARIVENTAQLVDKYGMGAHPTDLDPMYVLRQIDALERDLVIGREHAPIPLFGVLLRCFLSPKPLVFKHRLSRVAFDRVLQIVRATFVASLAQPGEVVGITAAQSIGEPTTQLSQESSARVLVKESTGMYSGAIGRFVDDVLEANRDRVVDLGGSSVVYDLPVDHPEQDIFIVGVSNEEKTSWKRISQVSRHPANGGMVRIHTRSGKSTCATLSHSFLKRTTDSIEPVKGYDLKVGDRVPVARHIPVVQDPLQTITIGDVTSPLTRDLGWFFGVYLADGCITRNTIHVSRVIPEYQEKLRSIISGVFGETMTQIPKHQQSDVMLNGWDMSQYPGMDNHFTHVALAAFLVDHFRQGSLQKRVPAFVYASNLEFIRGVIGGYFDGDGNVGTGTGTGKSTVRSASVSEELTEDFILLLAYVGIFATKCRERHVKEVARNDLHTVQVLRKHARKFKEEVGFVVRSKADALDALVAYVERDDVHSLREDIDMVPELGNTIAAVGKALELEGQSRLYGRFAKKEAIGRETLRKFIHTFEEGAFVKAVQADEAHSENAAKIAALQHLHDTARPNARNVISIPKDNGKMISELGSSVKKSSGLSQWANLDVIGKPTLARIIAQVTEANDAKRARDRAAVDAVEPHLAILRQAAESDVVWDEIVKLERLDDPGEMVYDFTVPGNDSFMVDCGVLVHNTLNSVHYDEELLLYVDGKLERTKIGDFTHRIMDSADPSAKEKHAHDAHFAWVRDQDVKVIAVDEHGKVDWQTVEAVTHHPVVNEDGSGTLLHVRTRTGRTLTATRGRSFLKRVNNKIVALNGSDLRVGDRIPVSTVLLTRDVAAIDYLRVEDYLPPTDWLYMSHVERALAVKAEGERQWFGGLAERGIFVPYKRSDSVNVAFVGTPRLAPTRRDNSRPGHVYPANISKCDSVAHIPERIPLDEDFGWLVGAYLSEGCIAMGANKKGAPERPYAVLICNMQPEFKLRFERFCERYTISYHIDAGTRLMKSDNRSPTVSLRMHNLLLGELFIKMFGNGAANKRVDPTLFGAPDAFLLALLDGYWSGDGSVSKGGQSMSAYSASGPLLVDIQQIMVRFGIMTSLHQTSEYVHQYNQERFDSTTRGHTLSVPAVGRSRFRELIDLCVASKRRRLELSITDMTHAVYDIVPDIELSTGHHSKVSRARIPYMLQGAETDEDRQVLQHVLDETIFYDEVLSIEEVPNAGHDRVYDLTVANFHTFGLVNGILTSNTFHLSGVSSASGTITQGVPRLRELFHVSNTKTPRMEIYAKPEYALDMERVMGIMNSIQTARFRELVKSSCVYYDPHDDPDRTLIPEDRDILRMHAAYADLVGSCDRRKSPWLLRFEFDRMRMLEKQVYFSDINLALQDHYKDDTLTCIFSDDNSARLVCRARLLVPEGMDRNDILTDVLALEQGILEGLVIKGVRDIEKAVLDAPKDEQMSYDEVSGGFVKRREWRIITDGSNMVEVMANPYVDYPRTKTNNVTEVLAVLGVEAARAALFDELQSVMWMSDSENVNYRHMALLVDTMTNRGNLIPIDRHGIKKGDIGPLAKCSFEETDEMLIRAGVFCELDKINGVSANIMLGQVPPCGTGEGDIIMDTEALMGIDRSVLDDAYMPSVVVPDGVDEEEYGEQQDQLTAEAVRLPEPDRNLVPKEQDDIILV